ncbi:MAG: ribosome small subunit-dependent GTPase A [Ruminococcus sp.]|jgi:ribosome biogenesis GTPase|nr:ribosome small subunit-dependent GTPase A [Ruminococcus sp.]
MNKIRELTETYEGKILKSVGGVYTVETENTIIECKARGIFRKDGITPYVGDSVNIMKIGDSEAVIVEVLPRKNDIVRPPVANVDCIVFVMSTVEPSPNLEILDKFLAIAEFKNITSYIAVTKTDLAAGFAVSEFINTYDKTVADVFPIDYDCPESYLKLYNNLADKTVVFTGNTGVGKSTLLNRLDSNIKSEVGEISRKLGRGRHTTRTVTLFKLPNNAYVADTPGFGVFETTRYDYIYKENLAHCFKDFRPYLGNCRFQDCTHTKEIGCEVIEAVRTGKIPQSRFDNYIRMYDEVSLIKLWKMRQTM